MFPLEDVPLSDFRIRSFVSLSGGRTHVSRLIVEEPYELECVMVVDDGGNTVDTGWVGLFDSQSPHSGEVQVEPSATRPARHEALSHPSCLGEELS